MNNEMSFFDMIFALWPSPAAMAKDMRVETGAVRRWVDRGKIPMGHWPLLMQLCAEKFDRRLTLESLTAATLARRGAADRRVGALGLFPKGKQKDDGQAQEAA